MTHGHAHHFLFLSLSLVLGAISTGACDTLSSDRAESRSLPGGCLLDCDDGGDGNDGDDGYDGGDGNDSSNDGCYEPCVVDGKGGCGGEPDGCTLTLGYWKNHHDGALNESQDIVWPVSYDCARLNGKPWLDILKTPPKGNSWYIGAHQWIAAKLNMANGAPAPAAVVKAADELEKYLIDQQYAPCVGKDGALVLAKLLDDYNNGKVGPAHCGDKEAGVIEKYNYDVDICGGKDEAEGKQNFGLKK